ncbi:MAG: hypothetical protein JW828_00280, partial [Sedimentisphaerales bacterium]|nr:hypothetical protein [Sedimentisphaerales bacterium]
MRPCIILFGFLFAFMLTQVCTAAVADHVFWMEIEVLWHYGDPIEPSDTEYEFDIEIQTDAMVRRVEVLTPGGLTFEIPALPDQYNWETDTWTNYEYDSQEDVWIWEYEKTTVSLAELNVYGDGWYRVTVIYEVGFDQTMLWFGIPNTTQPLAQPTQQ